MSEPAKASRPWPYAPVIAGLAFTLLLIGSLIAEQATQGQYATPTALSGTALVLIPALLAGGAIGSINKANRARREETSASTA